MHIDVISKKLSKAEKVAICEFHMNRFGRRLCNIPKLNMDRLDKVIADERINIPEVVHEMNRHIEEQRVVEHRKNMELEKSRREREDKNRKIEQKQTETNNTYIEVWKGLKPLQREFIAKSVYAKEKESIERRMQKDIRLAEKIISDHNKIIDCDRFPERLLNVTDDVILTTGGLSIPKLRFEICNNGWNALPETFVEDVLQMDTPPTIVLLPEMLYQFKKANLITAHIRVAPNGKKYIPMKRITRRYL